MLVASLVEYRGAERVGLIANVLTEPGLETFYAKLHKAEKKHAHVFVYLLLKEYPEELVYPRLEELMQEEARIIEKLPWPAALHR